MNEKRKGIVVFTKYSPYTVIDCRIENYKGEVYDVPRTVSLCRCGTSKHKPFCDGAHSHINFDNERVEDKKYGPKVYKGEKINVYFDYYLCRHAAKCVTGCPDIFDPDQKPWINLENVKDVDKLVKVIESCPSGALSYALPNEERKTVYSNVEKIVIDKNGAINIIGGVELIDDNNSAALLESVEHYSLCRCGCSKHKPFCDGTHMKVHFKDDNKTE